MLYARSHNLPAKALEESNCNTSLKPKPLEKQKELETEEPCVPNLANSTQISNKSPDIHFRPQKKAPIYSGFHFQCNTFFCHKTNTLESNKKLEARKAEDIKFLPFT